ncbi:MAG: thioredoxin [Firmicutes bacterium]|nr:thioredoxin [Candidatus Caballimonas caccae]
MSNIINIKNSEEFEKEINCEMPVLVDFYATWCNPCRLQGPIIEEINEELNGKIKVLKVDVDKNEEISVNLNVMSIPTLIIYKNGNIVEETVGLTPKESLMEKVKKYL